MAKEIQTISIRAYADKLRIDEKAIRKAIADGKIKKGVIYVPQVRKGKAVQVPKIIETVANKEYGHLKAIPKVQSGVSKQKVSEKLDHVKSDKKKESTTPINDDNSELLDVENMTYDELLEKINIHSNLEYKDILKKRELLGAAMDKMKLQKELGILVEKSLIDKQLFETGNNLKRSFQNIPSRVVPLIRASTNDVEATNILIYEINQVLETLSKINDGTTN